MAPYIDAWFALTLVISASRMRPSPASGPSSSSR